MTYTEPPRSEAYTRDINNIAVDYHDRVRWGPIIGGIVVAISAQLILSSFGAAIGLSIGAGGADAGDISLGVGIWSIISLLIALFIGSWLMARACGPMNRKTALLNGTILWATTLAVSAWLLASGVSGTFGIVASSASQVVGQVPGVIPDQPPNVEIDPETVELYAARAARAAWSFLLGALLGLVASLIGASAGARKPRNNYTT